MRIMASVLILLGTTTLFSDAQPRTLYFVARECLFDYAFRDRDECNLIFLKLRRAAEQLGYKVQTTADIVNLQDAAAVVLFDLPRNLSQQFIENLQKYPREKLMLYLWEPPLHDPLGNSLECQKLFGKVFSLWTDHIDGKHVLQNFYAQPRLEMIPDTIAFNQKKLCTMIVGYKLGGGADSLYGERLKAIEFFERLPQDVFDLYGAGWPARKSYKGTVPDKKDYIKQYRFSICYENSHVYKGYITEKIFDCFVAGCVPVYWGAPDITRYIPKNCFIDRRDFKTLDDLYIFLNSMNSATYENYLTHIKAFLASDEAYYYSADYFVDAFFTALNPSYDRSSVFSQEQQDTLLRLRNRKNVP